MRAGELAGLDADAVVRIGAGHWLRIPLGKLRNDRYMPLHPELVQLLAAWTAANLEHTGATTAWSPTIEDPSNDTGFDASSKESAAPAASPSIHTNCATPLPPRPSTGACVSKPSRPSSVTAPSP